MFDGYRDLILGYLLEFVYSCGYYLAAGVVGVFLSYSLMVWLVKTGFRHAAETAIGCLIALVLLYLSWPQKPVYIPPVSTEERQ